MQRHCAADAALVNNWEEMSGTHYNMQQYTNVFMSWCCVGGWILFHTDGVMQENSRGSEKSLFRLPQTREVFLFETDIVRLNMR